MYRSRYLNQLRWTVDREKKKCQMERKKETTRERDEEEATAAAVSSESWNIFARERMHKDVKYERMNRARLDNLAFDNIPAAFYAD